MVPVAIPVLVSLHLALRVLWGATMVVAERQRSMGLRRALMRTIGQPHRDLGRREPGTVDWRDVHVHPVITEAGRKLAQPACWRAERHECTQQHVSADACGGIDDGNARFGRHSGKDGRRKRAGQIMPCDRASQPRY